MVFQLSTADPYSHPVRPMSIPRSLSAYANGNFREALPQHHNGVDIYALLDEVNAIYRFGSQHPLVNVETAWDMVRRVDMTSLSMDQTETDEKIQETVNKARGIYFDQDARDFKQLLGPDGQPLETQGVILHGMVRNETRVNPKLALAARLLAGSNVRLGFVHNYDSHGNLPLEKLRPHVGQCIRAIRSIEQFSGDIDVDTVIDYGPLVEAFMPGTDPERKTALLEQVREKLLAVWEETQKHEAHLKVIQETGVHAWNPADGFFAAGYEGAWNSLDLDGQGGGAEYYKNGTGHPARGGKFYMLGEPVERRYNLFVSKDRAFPELLLPGLMAVRDVNEAYKDVPGFVPKKVKTSGDIMSIYDMVVHKFICDEFGIDYMAGGSDTLVNNLLEYIWFETKGDCDFTPDAFNDAPRLDLNPDLDPFAAP